MFGAPGESIPDRLLERCIGKAVTGRPRLHRLRKKSGFVSRKKSGFVSGYRFSDTGSPSKIKRPFRGRAAEIYFFRSLFSRAAKSCNGFRL
jgi:hypothetical protein